MDNLGKTELETAIANEISRNAEKIREQIAIGRECAEHYLEAVKSDKPITELVKELYSLHDFVGIARDMVYALDARNKALVTLNDKLNPQE